MRREPEPIDTRTDYLQKLGYEPRDVSVEALVKWGIGLFVGTALTAAATYGLYLLFVQQEVAPAGPAAATVRRLPPADYRLQDHPTLDIKQFRMEEDERTHNYARLTPDGRVLRIPVEQAMDLTLRKGLPFRGMPAGTDRSDRSVRPGPATPTTEDAPGPSPARQRR